MMLHCMICMSRFPSAREDAVSRWVSTWFSYEALSSISGAEDV